MFLGPFSDSQTVTFPDPLIKELREAADEVDHKVLVYAAPVADASVEELQAALVGAAKLLRKAANELRARS